MSFTTVTPLSKLLALICFILFPFIGFYLGMQYNKMLTKPYAMPVMKATKSQSSCTTQNTCPDDAKVCSDGTYVFRKSPKCEFALCPNEKPKVTPLSLDEIKKAGSKDEQIILQVSHKSGIPKENLIMTTKNIKNDEFAGGSYTEKTNDALSWWVAAKKDDVWLVTALGSGTPSCADINPYKYPNTVVPACKDAQDNIIKR